MVNKARITKYNIVALTKASKEKCMTSTQKYV